MQHFMSYLKLMRVTQWTKNGFVLMPLIFGGHLFYFGDVVKVLGMLLAFCLTSSVSYIINDYMDMDLDRVHPLKRFRPLAAGAVSPKGAFTLGGLLMLGALASLSAVGASLACYFFLAAYLVLQILYSVKLKNIVIVDFLTISIGFLLRVLSGGAVIDVPISSWLILCTFSIALFLAVGKRRHEVVMLTEDASNHRPVLANYNVGLLNQVLQVVATSTFIFYCLYSVRGNPAVGIQGEKMMFTIPLVAYGIFRYLYLIYGKEDAGAPSTLLLTDRPILICVVLWMIACIAIIHL